MLPVDYIMMLLLVIVIGSVALLAAYDIGDWM